MSDPPLYLYLVRIIDWCGEYQDDRAYGFRVVAIVAPDEDVVMQMMTDKYGAYFGDRCAPKGGHYARIEDVAIVSIGATVTLEYEE